MRTPQTPLQKLARLDELIVKNNERLARANAGPHVPRPEAPPRDIPPAVLTPDQKKLQRAHRKKAATRRGGSASTILSGPCDPSCPACAQERRAWRHGARIKKLQDAALFENAKHDIEKKTLRQRTNTANAKMPRMSRGPGLGLRGIICALHEDWNFTAESLRDRLDTERMTYDDDDLELSLSGDDIVVTDLFSGETVTIKKSSQREYLKRARHS